MKKTDTWMPLYIGDYLADTSRLTTEQHGAYLLLLMDYWRNGPPPDDEAVLASIVKLPLPAWRRHAPALRGFFTVEGGQWLQGRADAERTKANGVSEKRSGAGKAGAEARWGDGKPDDKPDGPGSGKAIANAMANTVANASQNDAPSQSQSQETRPPSEAPPRPSLAAVPSPPPAFDGGNAKAIPDRALVPLDKAFDLPEEWGVDAEALGFPRGRILTESERFRQWWTVGKGAERRKTRRGWRQAWSNWLGKAAERAA